MDKKVANSFIPKYVQKNLKWSNRMDESPGMTG